MPDDQDYADLGELLSRPEQWNEADAARARSLREHQATAAAAFDQRDEKRAASMWGVVAQLDDALAVWEASR